MFRRRPRNLSGLTAHTRFTTSARALYTAICNGATAEYIATGIQWLRRDAEYDIYIPRIRAHLARNLRVRGFHCDGELHLYAIDVGLLIAIEKAPTEAAATAILRRYTVQPIPA